MVLDMHVWRHFRVQRGPDGTGRAHLEAFSCTVSTRLVLDVHISRRFRVQWVPDGVWSLPSIHLRHTQQGFCVLAAGIAACGGFLLAVSTEKDRYTHYRWIGGRIADAPIIRKK